MERFHRFGTGKIFLIFFIFFLPSGVATPSLNEIQTSSAAKAERLLQLCRSQTYDQSNVMNGESMWPYSSLQGMIENLPVTTQDFKNKSSQPGLVRQRLGPESSHQTSTQL